MLNTYTLTAYKKKITDGETVKYIPCFIVTIEHIMVTGVYCFKTIQEAKEFITTQKNDLAIYGDLAYNPGECSTDHAKVIESILSCDDIEIGENGETYSKALREKQSVCLHV